MARTRIKVCGMTRAEDVCHAAAAGVDAVGFIFVPESPRMVEPEEVREMVRRLPPFVAAVGVFVDEEPERVNHIVRFCGLNVVQLHGGEGPDACRQVEAPVIKAFRVGDDLAAADLARFRGVVAGFLLDTYVENLAGGTGKVFDWSRVERLAPPGPVILAGGLGPENVAQAVRSVRPYAVDVNSGVETAPGRKDALAIDRVVRAVRGEEMARAHHP